MSGLMQISQKNSVTKCNQQYRKGQQHKMSKGAQFGIESHEVIPKPQVLVTEKLDLLQVYGHKSQKALPAAR